MGLFRRIHCQIREPYGSIFVKLRKKLSSNIAIHKRVEVFLGATVDNYRSIEDALFIALFPIFGNDCMEFYRNNGPALVEYTAFPREAADEILCTLCDIIAQTDLRSRRSRLELFGLINRGFQ